MSDGADLSTPVPGLAPRSQPIDGGAWEIPHPSPFLCEILIGHDQVSRAIPHVSNVEYVKWLDRAAELHADSLGYTRRHMLDQQRMWFVARHEIDYLAEVWPEDRIVIATWVRDMVKVRSWRDYLILRCDSEGQPTELVGRGATLWVLVDLLRRKPVRIPDDMVRGFEPLTAVSTAPPPVAEPDCS